MTLFGIKVFLTRNSTSSEYDWKSPKLTLELIIHLLVCVFLIFVFKTTEDVEVYDKHMRSSNKNIIKKVHSPILESH